MTIERAALESYPALPHDTETCPPDFLVRAAVLEADEPVLFHVARCGRCMNTYMGALGGEWLSHRPH
jgi:hypothetical protein